MGVVELFPDGGKGFVQQHHLDPLLAFDAGNGKQVPLATLCQLQATAVNGKRHGFGSVYLGIGIELELWNPDAEGGVIWCRNIQQPAQASGKALQLGVVEQFSDMFFRNLGMGRGLG